MVHSSDTLSRASKHARSPDREREFDSKERDAWWMTSLRPTPIPGFYPVRDFLQDAQLNPVKATYNFKSEGRKKYSIFQQMPDLTLPDTFTFVPPSFVDLARKKKTTYSFKSTPRQSPACLNYRDKNIDTDPGQYDLFPSPVPTFPTKNYMFRSAVQRFPTFCPKEGPGPGEYEIKDFEPVPLRSCFLSTVPRLMPASTKVPGPGSYWPTKQSPKQPRTIASMGREHTLFFSNLREI
ncbi:protein STPG4 isoform X2 [Hemicordylus capensis]|uniref:protein STPG4 isoform X2 n=1 Tax=Hemicordylus capensis TaxID=884348 RepID=UPI002302583A|nr:protein STPG4 isoform X2 [Hemicordylus capensis]